MFTRRAIRIFNRVAEFHETFGHPIADGKRTMADEDLNRLRCGCFVKEVDELEDAMWTADPVAALGCAHGVFMIRARWCIRWRLAVANTKKLPAAEVHRSEHEQGRRNGKAIVDEGGKVDEGAELLAMPGSRPDSFNHAKTLEGTE